MLANEVVIRRNHTITLILIFLFLQTCALFTITIVELRRMQREDEARKRLMEVKERIEKDIENGMSQSRRRGTYAY